LYIINLVFLKLVLLLSK